MQEMGFSCHREGSLIEIPPQWSTPGSMPIPSKVSPIIPLIIASSSEDPTLLFTSGLEREEVRWVKLGEVLIGSLSLTINVWFPRPILSRRVQSGGRSVWFSTASHDCLHSGNKGFLQVVSVCAVGVSTLLWCERGIVFKGSCDESTCVMHGCVLGHEVGENLIEYFDGLNLECASAGAGPRGPPIVGVNDFQLTLNSGGVCILTHFQVSVVMSKCP